MPQIKRDVRVYKVAAVKQVGADVKTAVEGRNLRRYQSALVCVTAVTRRRRRA